MQHTQQQQQQQQQHTLNDEATSKFEQVVASAASSEVAQWRYQDYQNAIKWANYVKQLQLAYQPEHLIHEAILTNACAPPRLTALALEDMFACILKQQQQQQQQQPQATEHTMAMQELAEQQARLISSGVHTHTTAWLLLQTLDKIRTHCTAQPQVQYVPAPRTSTSSSSTTSISTPTQCDNSLPTTIEAFLAYWHSQRIVSKRAVAREMIRVLCEVYTMHQQGTDTQALETYVSHIQTCCTSNASVVETVAIAVVLLASPDAREDQALYSQVQQLLVEAVADASYLLKQQQQLFQQSS
jgi:hypothetical protein